MSPSFTLQQINLLWGSGQMGFAFKKVVNRIIWTFREFQFTLVTFQVNSRVRRMATSSTTTDQTWDEKTLLKQVTDLVIQQRLLAGRSTQQDKVIRFVHPHQLQVNTKDAILNSNDTCWFVASPNFRNWSIWLSMASLTLKLKWWNYANKRWNIVFPLIIPFFWTDLTTVLTRSDWPPHGSMKPWTLTHKPSSGRFVNYLLKSNLIAFWMSI